MSFTKTKIADTLLTIIQCIEQNIEAGVIKRDKFKIVYVEHGADEGSCYEDDS